MKRALSFILAAAVIFTPLCLTSASAAGQTYKSLLSDGERDIYDALVYNLSDGAGSFEGEFEKEQVFDDAQEAGDAIAVQAARAYEAFYRDHPEIFWLNKSGFTLSPRYSWDGEYVTIYGFSCTVPFTTGDYTFEKTQLDGAVGEILSAAPEGDYEKILYFHDTILSLCSYNDYAASYYEPLTCEAYGALVMGDAVCEGYAKAMKLLCDGAGIPCEIVGGTAQGQKHMWNAVYLDGEYFIVDATFDDAEGGTYDYFLKGSLTLNDRTEDPSLLSVSYASFGYPEISLYDYSGGGASPSNPGDGQSLPDGGEEPGEPARDKPHAPAENPVPPGLLRVKLGFSKNGGFLVASGGGQKFIRGKEADLAPGTEICVFAMPDEGFSVKEIKIVFDDGEVISQKCASVSFTLNRGARIYVTFKEKT